MAIHISRTFDGHISRIDELLLRYVNDPRTRCGTGLGAPFGTEFYKFHDDERQNGAPKTSLIHEKGKLFLKKRMHGLPAEMLQVEIVIVARGAILKSFMNSAYAEAALARRGFNPFNRHPLDAPVILRTAPEDIQLERAIVLRSWGINNSLAAPPPPTQRDIFTTGSGRLAGGAAAADELQQSAAELNYTGFTASGIMTLTQNPKSKNNGRRANMGADASMERRLPPDVLKSRYREAKRMTAGVVFGRGDGVFGIQIRDEVIHRNATRKAKAKATKANNKKNVRELAAKVDDIRDEMASPPFVMLNKHLETLIRYKTRKGDKKLPSKKKTDILQRWNKIKGRQSPHVSPYNYGEESEGDTSDDDANGNGNDASDYGDDDDDDSDDGKFDDGDDLIVFLRAEANNMNAHLIIPSLHA